MFKVAITLFLIIASLSPAIEGEYFSSKGLDSYRLELLRNGHYKHRYSGCTLGFEATGRWVSKNDTIYLKTEDVKNLYLKRKNSAASEDLWTTARSIHGFVIRNDSNSILDPLNNKVIYGPVTKIKG